MISPTQMRITLPLLALATLCGAGCSWRSPRIEFYTLSPLAKSEVDPAAAGPALEVGPATFPTFLQRTQIATRSGENRLVYDESHRWGGSLEQDFLRVLGENLALLMHTERVVVYPIPANFPIAFRVALDVQRFDGRPGDSVTLKARWTVSSGNRGSALAADASDINVPVTSNAHEDLVAAHSAAVAALSREIATAITKLAAAAP